MARSVSFPSGAHLVIFTSCRPDEDDPDLWGFCKERLLYELEQAFPSVVPDDYWYGREDHAIAHNKLADFGLSEYCGLVAFWAVPCAIKTDLALHWLDSNEPKLRECVKRAFGSVLRHIGTASNGFLRKGGVMKTNQTSNKTPGQLAYEQDCRNCPTYPGGDPRHTWEQLSPVAKDSWERNPTPRGGW